MWQLLEQGSPRAWAAAHYWAFNLSELEVVGERAYLLTQMKLYTQNPPPHIAGPQS